MPQFLNFPLYPAIYKHEITPAPQSGYTPIWDQSLIPNVYIDLNNGAEIAYNGWSATDYIDISDNSDGVVYRLGQIGQNVYNAFYDANKNFISSFGGVGYNGGNTIPNNAVYVRFSGGNASMVGEVLRKE